MSRKQKEEMISKGRLEWKEARDYWLNDSPMARGNNFNAKAVEDEWYPYNEVNLKNGKRLDSYDPNKGEIVSRKATDLANTGQSTFEVYLNEHNTKYAPGKEIRSNKYPELDGKKLEGRQILEIPASNIEFSKMEEYIKLSKEKYNIEIRFREE